MAKVGDTTTSGGTKTTVTNIDPETSKITWSVEYLANYGELFKEVSQLYNDAREVAQKAKNEPFFKDYFNDVKTLRNRLRTYLRTEHPDAYAKIKGIDEASISGGGVAGGSFEAGTGEQYATPFAFNKDKKAKGTASNYYYKLGFKPVNQEKLRKQSKGTDYIDLYKKK